MTSWIGNIPFAELGMDQDKLTLLGELVEDSEYWRSVSSFIQQIENVKLFTLSDNQRYWLESTIATLAVELNRMTAREVFEC